MCVCVCVCVCACVCVCVCVCLHKLINCFVANSRLTLLTRSNKALHKLDGFFVGGVLFLSCLQGFLMYYVQVKSFSFQIFLLAYKL